METPNTIILNLIFTLLHKFVIMEIIAQASPLHALQIAFKIELGDV
jgi:hypothetical protein